MFTIQEILNATQGTLIQGDPAARVKGVSTDSRAIRPHDAFIAIRGENFDGHDFVAKLSTQGVKTVIVSRPVKVKSKSTNVIRVKDTVRAFGHLALYHRLRFNIPVIGITGSAGKTTTKDMITAVLKTRYNVLFNVGTHNNHMGVPATLLKLTPQHEAAVIEMGTNQPGDIPWLAEITRPTIAVLTNIGESHLEKLKNLDGVFQEKMTLAKAVGPGGWIVYNKDDRYLKKIGRAKWAAGLAAYSLKENSHNRALKVALDRRGFLSFKLQKKVFFLKTFSTDMTYNALAAVSCARILKVSMGKVQKALGHFRFEKGRQELLKAGGVDIINDTYNANPVSMRSAIKTLDDFPTSGHRILICADMLELGREAEGLHRQTGRAVADSKTEVLMTMGEQSRWIVEAAQRSRPELVVFNFSNVDDLNQYLRVLCHKGDVVLVKGSRRMKMEKVVEFLMAELRK
jgi:UDP-N-acetylmuramoyl-tripeptide--D-alanyl-D-alanine ligase